MVTSVDEEDLVYWNLSSRSTTDRNTYSPVPERQSTRFAYVCKLWYQDFTAITSVSPLAWFAIRILRTVVHYPSLRIASLGKFTLHPKAGHASSFG